MSSSANRFSKKHLPRAIRFFVELVPSVCIVFIVFVVFTVDTDDTDEASSSLLNVIALIRLEAVVLCLFFLGNDGRIFPGSSVRIFLCILAKSPYRRPMWYSSPPFRFTLSRKSCDNFD